MLTKLGKVHVSSIKVYGEKSQLSNMFYSHFYNSPPMSGKCSAFSSTSNHDHDDGKDGNGIVRMREFLYIGHCGNLRYKITFRLQCFSCHGYGVNSK